NSNVIKSLKKQRKTRDMDIREKWDNKYETKLANMNTPVPNERLLYIAPCLRGGAALDIACGLGGNSFFLAENGFNVTAVDISEVAINYVKEKAVSNGLQIKSLAADLSNPVSTLFRKSYDLVLITYFLDRALFPKVKGMVKDKGFFFMETFYRTMEGGNQAISEKYKLESNELLKEFKDWKILYFEENEQEGRQTIFCQKYKQA
ncbi:MAG: methyltransferase domain-containing protein, partial [Mesobacillus sp.]|uniref:class I SAM-dependent methyltransferase n=1 Tax=Mesobacillus sp. TaxID=2675271 RepID=UPI003C5F007A